MTKSEIFTKAHQIAKSTAAKVGHYVIAFSLALKEVYQSMKSVITTEAKLINLGLSVWENGKIRRIYINWWQFKEIFGFEIWKTRNGRFDTDALNISKATATQWAHEKHFYDCVKGEFDTSIPSYLIPAELKND